MLYIIAGPSGAGKTTFINIALKEKQHCKVIPVDVYSSSKRQYAQDLGRRTISLDEFTYNSSQNLYSSVCLYLNNKYGFSIPDDYNCKDIAYLLDYPGDYPECADIKDYFGKGILILPPSSIILKERLLKCNRMNRIKSSEAEYYDCLDDISKKRLDPSLWSIVINDRISTLYNATQKLII